MDGLSLVATREHEFKEIILLGFIICKTLNYKASRINLFEGGYYDMIPKGHIWGRERERESHYEHMNMKLDI
jgi:hypothetical protein